MRTLQKNSLENLVEQDYPNLYVVTYYFDTKLGHLDGFALMGVFTSSKAATDAIYSFASYQQKALQETDRKADKDHMDFKITKRQQGKSTVFAVSGSLKSDPDIAYTLHEFHLTPVVTNKFDPQMDHVIWTDDEASKKIREEQTTE